MIRPSDIPFDISYTFDSDLRDVPHSPQEMEKAVLYLEARIASGELDELEEIQALGMAGVLLRVLGRLDKAHDCLERAVALCKQQGNVRGELVNTLRLAHVYQWQRDYATADALFSSALAWCKSDPSLADYLDFAYQHTGKSLFDQGRYHEAAEMFERALKIRLNKGDAELIGSTRLALETTQTRIKLEA